ncbi:MAG: lamin tail domain-containing protein [Planctomycetes bacterium]|nr:lamin tail domain-containing protein [Planctomycetota bacterium]
MSNVATVTIEVLPNPGDVVINEVLAHSDEAAGDWIELRNTTGAAIDLGGWFLSDEAADPLKYQIPAGTMIPARGFLTFTQTQHFGSEFSLSELGDEVILQAARDGATLNFQHRVELGASENGRTLGRFVKTTGGADFVAMENATFGTANSDPLVDPVVIEEIMYNPGPVGGNRGGEEFIELRNITSEPVPLFDPARPANTWAFTSGINFTFLRNDTLAAGALALVVPSDPATFRAAHNVPAEVRIFGPYAGSLNDNGAKIELSRPGEPTPENVVPMIAVDRVTYEDTSPWPTQADGQGWSLQRKASDEYGNDPINWSVTIPDGTPGSFVVAPQVTEVLVSASGWSPAMLDRLSAAGLGEGGFSIPAGADQLRTVTWTGVDRLSIRFSEHVEVTSGDLRIAGVNVHEYRIIDFQYDRPALTATWTLERPVRTDNLLVELSAAVRDASGLPLDGNWENAVSNFPSGNGAIDSDDAFQFRVNVAPADVTGVSSGPIWST